MDSGDGGIAELLHDKDRAGQHHRQGQHAGDDTTGLLGDAPAKDDHTDTGQDEEHHQDHSPGDTQPRTVGADALAGLDQEMGGAVPIHRHAGHLLDGHLDLPLTSHGEVDRCAIFAGVGACCGLGVGRHRHTGHINMHVDPGAGQRFVAVKNLENEEIFPHRRRRRLAGQLDAKLAGSPDHALTSPHQIGGEQETNNE